MNQEIKAINEKVKRASKNKRSINDVLKNQFFTGKCEPIMSAKNLCFTK